jgi:1L-myo-inositol 1-phosphate cytidylyltransferase
VTRISAGGIIAAGEGSRLREAGIAKPLVPVAGEPLIAHVLENFAAAGVRSVSVIFNGEEEDCAAFVRERYRNLAPKILVQTTASSLESFHRILAISPEGPLLVSTVDAFCPREDFVAFVRAAEETPETTVLAVTPFVADEKPLWVRWDSSGRVSHIGGTSGDAVTAGIYVVAPNVRNLHPPSELVRLREFLSWLCAGCHPLRALSIPRVVDVDRPEDVRLAEEMARDEAELRARA